MFKYLAKLSKNIRVLFYISMIIKFLILVAIVTALYEHNWNIALIAFLTLIVSFLPTFLSRRFHLFLPPEFELTFLIFLYGSIILGSINQFYEKIPWWDVWLHSLSAVMFALVGFMIIYSLYLTDKVIFSPIFAALFSFCFAMAIGGVWEIYEFGIDQFFGTNMQRSGLMDTMWDLIVDGVAALIVSIIGFFYLKGGDSLLMERFVKKFINMNEKLRTKKQGLI
jgi:hypothetical protein